LGLHGDGTLIGKANSTRYSVMSYNDAAFNRKVPGFGISVNGNRSRWGYQTAPVQYGDTGRVIRIESMHYA